jgi:hypothetical protein
MANRKDKPTIEPTTKARAGVTGHNVRYVLAFGLVGVIIAFLILPCTIMVFRFSWGTSPTGLRWQAVAVGKFDST